MMDTAALYRVCSTGLRCVRESDRKRERERERNKTKKYEERKERKKQECNRE